MISNHKLKCFNNLLEESPEMVEYIQLKQVQNVKTLSFMLLHVSMDEKIDDLVIALAKCFDIELDYT